MIKNKSSDFYEEGNIFSRKGAKKCNKLYILFEKLEIFSSGPAFGSTTPGPATALYAPVYHFTGLLLWWVPKYGMTSVRQSRVRFLRGS